MTEVDLCGHATLAAAHVLVSEGLVDPLQPIVFESKASGELVATSIGGSKLQLSFPATPPVSHEYNAEEMNYIKTAFGFADQDILYAGCTIYDKFFEVTSDAFSRISDIDFTLIGKFDCRGVIITSAGGKRQQTSNPRYKDYDITSRCFFPRLDNPDYCRSSVWLLACFLLRIDAVSMRTPLLAVPTVLLRRTGSKNLVKTMEV